MTTSRSNIASMAVHLNELTVPAVLLTLLLALLPSPFSSVWAAEQANQPLYKPSSKSPEPVNILTNGYGASRSAPEALEIGDRVPDFSLPRAGGGTIALADQLAQGTVVLVFYRGHW